MNENQLREEITLLGRSMFERGLTHGSTGNISARLEDGWLLTPTGSSLGRLEPARISKLDWNGRLLAGDAPSRESFLHLAMYQERKASGAVVHLHSVHAVAVSLLEEIGPDNPLPPLTAYFVMRIGQLALVPYHAPGDMGLANAVRAVAGKHHAVLLANHGPVVAGSDVAAAADAVEELEATAQLYLLLRGSRVRPLTDVQVHDLQRRYPS
jgi:ribulose-5-phosphate 4-epimerase/fuculose-1-phosphate aldolase